MHPTITGSVNNSGTLDLTNGSGSPGNTLVINGDLNSVAGIARLMTRLNEGGSLSNQATDNLQVLGNTTGTTFLDITAASGSTGAQTDTNNNGIADSNEGISVAQVAGTATADSFALLNGYAAAGPWRYDLYSFAPGSSDASQRRVAGSSDNQYWDYRLANSYINEDGSTGGTGGRLAVIPQVPAYITAPVGLAYYTAAIVDDLHKRLGDLRQQKAYDNGVGGEMFVRYVGSTLEHKSDLSFKNFSYNLDIDYNALQLGGNVVKLDGASDSLRGGLAYTRGRTKLTPHAVDGYSNTVFNSDSIALYSTWLRDSGFYVDGALSYDWHRGETDVSHQKTVGKLKARGWSASVESGYPFILQNDVRLEPQAQLTYMRLNMDDFTDQDGARVQYDRYGQTIGRVGVRVDRSWSDGRGHLFTPWLRTNYYHGWGSNAKTNVSAAGGGGGRAATPLKVVALVRCGKWVRARR
ncbi:autotransporter outer membrane beta-barrel domain-containing protein [Erwinia sp. V71]|uniref:autotransporter family protein n=1 Tax=Erwinia sp. V71 TaxID=3369424 RepID=UPI003F604D36